MNKIVIITPYVRLETAIQIQRLLEDGNNNVSVNTIIVNEYMTFKLGVIYSGKVMSCKQLIVIRETDGSISTRVEMLVDLVCETDTHIYYFD